MADVVGLLVLAGLMVLTISVVPDLGIPTPFWLFVYVVLALICWYFWHSDKLPNKTTNWLWFVPGSIVLGGIFFGVDMMIGHFNYPDIPVVDAAKKAPGPFGLILTLAVCPGLTIISLASLARSLFASKFF